MSATIDDRKPRDNTYALIESLGLTETNSEFNIVDNDADREAKKQFKIRAKAFVSGANLLIRNLPSMDFKDVTIQQNFAALTDLIELRYNQYIDDIKNAPSLEDCQKLFRKLLAEVVLLIEDKTKLSYSKIQRYLTHAERLSNWQIQRKTVVSVNRSQGEDGQDDYIIVQADIPVTKLSVVQSEELIRIKDYPTASTESKNAFPEWFKRMEEWEKKYLINELNQGNITAENINDFIHTIPSSTRYVPGLANYTQHVLRIFKVEKNIVNDKVNYSYTLVAESKRDRSAVISPIDLHKNSQSVERQDITNKNLAQLLNASLGSYAERHLAKWRVSNELGKDANHPVELPVTIQTLLSPGIITSAMAKILGPSDNNAKMIKNKKIAIEKIRYAIEHNNKDFLDEVGLKMENGAIKVMSESGEGYWVKPNFIATNYAVNIFRKIPDIKNQIRGLFTTTQSNNDVNTIRLLNSVGKFLQQAVDFYDKTNPELSELFKNNLKEIIQEMHGIHDTHILTNEKRMALSGQIDKILKEKINTLVPMKNLNDLQMVLQAAQDYLITPLSKPLDRNRPFYLSSQEDILTEKCGGLPYGSCKSGKDRKGMAVLHIDAMLFYYERYKRLPRYDDSTTDRANFVKIFAELFATHHQQAVAAQNAPGAKGIKELKYILPKDIQDAIGKVALTQSNILGGLNKVKSNLSDDEKQKFSNGLNIKNKWNKPSMLSRLFTHLNKMISVQSKAPEDEDKPHF